MESTLSEASRRESRRRDKQNGKGGVVPKSSGKASEPCGQRSSRSSARFLIKQGKEIVRQNCASCTPQRRRASKQAASELEPQPHCKLAWRSGIFPALRLPLRRLGDALKLPRRWDGSRSVSGTRVIVSLSSWIVSFSPMDPLPEVLAEASSFVKIFSSSLVCLS